MSLPPSLPPCQSADLWLCLSEGHASLPTLLFVSTPLHFSTLPTLKPTRNQQKLTPGSCSLDKVCFVALPWLYVLQRNLTGLHSGSTVVLTKCWADPGLFRCCWEYASDIEKWHTTRMPLIMFRGKAGKMVDVTRPFYKPNFIRGFHVWAGKSGYFFCFFIL